MSWIFLNLLNNYKLDKKRNHLLVKNLESDFLSNIIAIRWSTKNELNNVVAVLESELRIKVGANSNDAPVMISWIDR